MEDKINEAPDAKALNVKGARQQKKSTKNSNKRLFYFSDPARAYFVAITLSVWNRHVRWSNHAKVANFVETNATKHEIFRIPKGFNPNWMNEKPIGFGLDFNPKPVEAEPIPVEPDEPSK